MVSKAALSPSGAETRENGDFPRLLIHTDPRELGQLLSKSVVALSQARGAKLAESSTSELAAQPGAIFTCLCSSGHRSLQLDCWGSETGIFLKVSKFVAICLSSVCVCVCSSWFCAMCKFRTSWNSAEGTNLSCGSQSPRSSGAGGSDGCMRKQRPCQRVAGVTGPES